jgi:hypothetical protein
MGTKGEGARKKDWRHATDVCLPSTEYLHENRRSLFQRVHSRFESSDVVHKSIDKPVSRQLPMQVLYIHSDPPRITTDERIGLRFFLETRNNRLRRSAYLSRAFGL